MTLYLADSWHLLLRHLRTTLRLPIWIFVMLVQPVIWLALYGQLFRRVTEIPGFGADSYIQFLTPGVVIMTALFGAAWSGMGLVKDLDDRLVDRLLATPIRRAAIITAPVLHAALTVVLQGVLVIALGILLGARPHGGVGGLLVVLAVAGLLAGGISALSNGVALLTRREETLIAVVNFFGMPLLFLSTAFMASTAMPDWIRTLAAGNPVNWAVDAARLALAGEAWGNVAALAGGLLAFVLATTAAATFAFRAYRRTA